MLSWMQWTTATAIGIGALFFAIGILTVMGIRKPDPGHKGFYPFETTRGDKLFLGIVTTLAFFFVWMALLGTNLAWLMVLLGLIWFFIQWIWG